VDKTELGDASLSTTEKQAFGLINDFVNKKISSKEWDVKFKNDLDAKTRLLDPELGKKIFNYFDYNVDANKDQRIDDKTEQKENEKFFESILYDVRSQYEQVPASDVDQSHTLLDYARTFLLLK